MADLVLRADPAHAAQAEEWFDAEALEREEGGGLRISLRVPEGDWVLKTVLGFGSGIEILEPQALREELSSIAACIAAANAPIA